MDVCLFNKYWIQCITYYFYFGETLLLVNAVQKLFMEDQRDRICDKKKQLENVGIKPTNN